MSSNDKTLPILLHKTWSGVLGPPCLGPWTGNQEPVHYRTIESTHQRPAYSVAAAQIALDGLARAVVRGPRHLPLAITSRVCRISTYTFQPEAKQLPKCGANVKGFCLGWG